jgi:hypothetical protein
MLKYIFETEAEIPEAVRAFYEESNGKWVLNCEGAAPAAKVDEFRRNNVVEKKKLEDFKDIDPTRYAELVEKEKDFENSKADNKEKIDELVAKRVEALKTDYEKKISELNATNEAATKQLTTLQIDQAVLTTATELGLRKGADADIIARANGVWKLVDGKPVAYKDDEQVFGKDGQPITMREWAETLSKSAPHLFEPNQGGGSGGGGNGGGNTDTGPNPWKSESFNLTQQAAILKEDPAKARRMAATAGKTIKI